MKKNRKRHPTRYTDTDILALCSGGGASLMLSSMGKGAAPANDTLKPAAPQDTAAEIAELRNLQAKARSKPTG